MPLPAKILTTGQFGADLGALRAGLILGIPTGGVMPREFMTQLGPRPWYDKQFGMTEHRGHNLLVCREENIAASHLSLVFGTVASAGARKAFIEPLEEAKQPFLVNPRLEHLQVLLDDGPFVIHVLGNREASNRGIEKYVTALLVDAWADLVPWRPLHDPREQKPTGGAIDPDKQFHGRLRSTAPYPECVPKLPVWTGA